MDEQSTKAPLRIGILGAARIAPVSLVRPAREVAGAEAYGVAARTPARAGDFQVKHGLARAFPNYDAMLSSDEIDAVYNPLPNGLLCEWTVRALEAGKHVLCEKPFASNADEAEQTQDGTILWQVPPLCHSQPAAAAARRCHPPCPGGGKPGV